MITFDFTHLTEGSIGRENGFSPAILSMYSEALRKGYAKIENGRGRSPYDFMELPYQDITAIVDFEKKLSEYRNFVVVGIGGSALGAYALFKALTHYYHNYRSDKRIFFCDNSEPRTLADLLDVIDLHETVFNVITKSGSTAETMSALSVITDILTEKGLALKDHIIATTDSEKGDLRSISLRYDLPTALIPSGVGGRYSVLTAVGLLPALFLGIDIKSLLDGAKAVDAMWRRTPAEENPIAISSLFQYLFDTQKHHNIVSMMCYKDGLYGVGLWYQQLWAESLGKQYSNDKEDIFVGSTPLIVRGATDQHSVLQLLMEGPLDKLVVFLDALDVGRDISFDVKNLSDYKSIDYFKGKTAMDLISSELQGVRYALASAQRPNYSITLDKMDAYHIGGLLYCFELQTVMAAALYDVNPFDQPGVEDGKKATYALMGREGYEHKRDEMNTANHDTMVYRIEEK